VPEHLLPRRTVAQIREHKRGLAPWRQKIASIVLDRLERLEEDGILALNRLRFAEGYSTSHVPIDEQARMLVELKVDNVEPFD
jgi:hypothetical protein